MPSPLENLCGPGKPLRQEAPDAKELAGLLQSGLRRLADAENPANSYEGGSISSTTPPTRYA